MTGALMNNIAKLRKLNGWNQTALAHAADVEQSTISKAENENGGVSLKVFKQIAAALDVPLYMLFLDDAQAFDLKLLQVFRQMPADRRQGWIDMAELALGQTEKSNQ